MKKALPAAVIVLTSSILIAAAPGGKNTTIDKHEFSTLYSNECINPGVFSTLEGTVHTVSKTWTDKDGVLHYSVKQSFSNARGIDAVTGTEFLVVGKYLDLEDTGAVDDLPFEREYTRHLIRVDRGAAPNEHWTVHVKWGYDIDGVYYLEVNDVTFECR